MSCRNHRAYSGSNVEGGFAVSMLKPLSELVQKPRRVQTGFREAKRTIVVARYPGVEVNNATHHVGEIGAAPRRCKSHPPKTILPNLFVPFGALTFTRSSVLATVSSRLADRSCLSIFHYTARGKYDIYSRDVERRCDSISIRGVNAPWIRRMIPRYCETRIRRFGIVLPMVW